jgi:hypothetical protein
MAAVSTGSSSWIMVAATVCALVGCRPYRVPGSDAGPSVDPAPSSGGTPGAEGGSVAENDADITRYPDEKGVDHLLGVTRLAASNARTQAGPSAGTVVAALPPGTSVDKIAVRRGWFLVVFIDPRDPSAGRRELGWLDPTDFVAPTGKLPSIHCELPRVAVLHGGRETCDLPPAPTAAPGVPPLTPTLPTVSPTVPTAAPRPTRPLDVKQQGGACAGGYGKCGALCRLQCGSDGDCGLATAHCQAGFCLGPGAQPCAH